MVDAVVHSFSAATALLDVLIVAFLVGMCVPSWRMRIITFIRQNALPLATALSGIAVAGTLYMQYADMLNPCMMCWWQRVFMYPVFVIGAIALAKRTPFRDIADFVLALSIVGFLIALYQHLLQVLPSGALIPCDASGDCAIRTVFDFGFVTIPWMAVTVFAALALIAFVARTQSR